MKIYLASDHAGFYLKEIIKQDFLSRGFLVEDFGAKNFKEDDDYPDYIYPCVKDFIKNTNGDTKKGVCIVLGGSGTGEAIVANKVRGARTVTLNNSNLEIIKLGRLHNNANVLSIGARFVEEKIVNEAIKIFMTTQFEGGRHKQRILKIDMLQ
jgi:ribose 5-phosphate isomerase B